MIRIFLFLFLVYCSSVSAQEWIRQMKDPTVNFYEVEKNFLSWKDSVQRNDRKSLLYRLFNRGKIELEKEFREEAQEHFYHWAAEIRDQIDERGNRLSSDDLWNRFLSLRQPGLVPQLQSQGNWYPRGPDRVREGYGNVLGVGRLANMVFDPADSMIIYVGTGSSGLWKTTDEGSTWSPLTDSVAGMYIGALAIDPSDGNILYKFSMGRLYKSLDAGVSWNIIGTFNQYNTFAKIIIDPANTQTLYMSIYPAGLLKSVDGGLSFDTVYSELFSDYELNPGNPQTLYLLAGGQYLIRSSDGGNTFDTAATMIPTNYSFQELAVTPADSNYIYAYAPNTNGYGGQVAQSVDGGNSFVVHPYSTAPCNWSQLYRFEASHTDKNFLVQGGMTIASSPDGGMSWSEITRYSYNSTSPLPFVHPDDRFMMFNGSSIWSCNDGALDKSMDRGLTWQTKSDGISCALFLSLACSESDTSVFMCGSWDNAITLHTDSGWVNIFSGDGFDAAIHPTNPLLLFGKNQYGYQRSFDGGVTVPITSFFNGLNESTYSFQAEFPMCFNKQNPNSLFLLVDNVWKGTNNNGDSLVRISSFTNGGGGRFLYVCDVDSNILFTSRYRTVNGGAAWSYLPYTVQAVDADEPGKVWSTGIYNGSKSVFFSTDTGNTWQPVPSFDLNFTNDLFMRCANNVYDGVFFVSNSAVYYLDNRLSNWQVFTNGLPSVKITDMKTLPASGIVRVATYGRGVWESDLSFDFTLPPVAGFVYDYDSVCPGETIHFYDDTQNNGPGYFPSYQWSFPGGIPSASTDANPVVMYPSAGTYDVSLMVMNTNGWDSIIKTGVICVSSPPSVALPLAEGFEGTVFPPYGWSWNRHGVSSWWYRSINVGGYALSPRSLAYYSYITSALSDEYFTFPETDLSAIPDPVLSFDYCYLYDHVYADTLKVFYSTDCGLTRHYIYEKGGLDLKTDTLINLPDSSSWRTDTLSLYSLSATGPVQLGFEVLSNTHCILYLDNINIQSLPGLGATDTSKDKTLFSVYPNPAAGSINLLLNGVSYGKAKLVNAVGITVWEETISGSEKLSVAHLPAGVYTVSFENRNGRETVRVVILR